MGDGEGSAGLLGAASDGAKKVVGAATGGAKRAVGAGAATAVGFWRGISYPFRGMKFVFWQHPSLIRFWGVPIVLTFVLIVGVIWGGWASHESIAAAVWSPPAATEGFWATCLGFLHSAFEILVLVLVWGAGTVGAVLLSNVIAAPFNDLLSEEVERLMTGTAGAPFSLSILVRDALRTVGLELMKLLFYLSIMVPLWLLSLLIPGVGQIVYSIFAFVFSAMYFALDYIDWPASRRNRSVTYRWSVLADNFMPMLGFGTGVWLFLLIPLVNLFFMPAAVAGGTLLFLEVEGREAEGPLPTPSAG